MSARRFACPHCGQHYATDLAWRDESTTCTACGVDFQPGAAPSLEPQSTAGAHLATEEPADPASVKVPPAPRGRIRVPPPARSQRVTGTGTRLAADACGFLTPLLFLAAMAFVAGLTGWLAIVACPVAIYFFALKLCEAILVFCGWQGLRDYVASTIAGFLVWTLVPPAAAFYLLADDDSGVGFVLVPALGFWLLAAGTTFASWAVASARFWKATSEDEKLK